MRWHRGVLSLGVLVLIVISFTPTISAQESYATLSGRITDPNGRVIVGANVQAVNVNTNALYPAESNEVGLYNFPALPPGIYRVVVKQEGFEQIVKTGLDLHVADSIAINFALQLGSVAQTLTISGDTPVVNTTTGSLGGLVNDEQMADLPLNGREYIDLTLLQPGITRQFSSSYSTGPRGGGLSGVWFSANGATIQSNNYLLDGQPMQNLYWTSSASLNGDTLGVDGIKEYKVVTSSYDATYGLVMGSQMLMVSKGGTNQWHGDAFEYLRNSVLDAKNFFDTSASSGLTADGAQRRLPEFRRNNFGASFGGPIKKDKTFFYGVYEGLRQNTGLTFVDIVPPAACHNLVPSGANYAFPTTAIASTCATGLTSSSVVAAVMVPFLNLYPLPTSTTAGSTTYATSAPEPASENFAQIRADQVISTTDSLFARYNLDYAALVIPSAFPQFFSADGNNWNHFATLSESHIFSPTVLNTARLSYSRTRFALANIFLTNVTTPQLSMVGNGTPIGVIQMAPYTNMGSGSGYPDNHIQNIIALSDDVFYTKGHHALKFGTLLDRFDDTTFHFQYG
jgi:hypothetical protein